MYVSAVTYMFHPPLSSASRSLVSSFTEGLGVFSSQIGVFPSRGVSFSQIGFFGSRGVSGSQVLVFSVPGLVFSLPSSCVGVFGSQVWAFSVLDNVFPARRPFTCLFVSFRLNFWLPLPTAGFESTYSCHTITPTKNTAKPSKPFAVKTCQFA